MGHRWVSERCFILLLALGGCTASGTSSRIGLLSFREPVDRIVILKRDVSGTSCPQEGNYGDYGAAIREAIASVPGANVLTHAKLSSAEVGMSSICVRATGNAGRLE